eukprot:TRINITY_DN3703_c0_g1_i2.p1 TRINITY_DN3703_c0_g1~~TRINITY_DN3703_c0_g1_i2.p1  ORF type:complete len:716 (-),score=250.14 TRINITY_DN3703_c0_g1_i2:132-2279(-)
MMRFVLSAALILTVVIADGSAGPKKSNAVNKVMKMLGDLAAKVEDEGVKEEKTYFKFNRFCGEATEERNTAINDGKVLIQELEALIDTKSARVEVLTLDIDTLNKDMETLKTEVQDAVKARNEERAQFEKDDAEIVAAIKALDRAVEGLQNSEKGPGPMAFLQFSNELKSAVLLADSMGFESNAATSILDAANAAPTVDYEFHSGGIVATLEKMQEDFRQAKTEASQAEITSRGAHTMTVQAKEQLIAKKTRQHQSATMEKDAATQAKGNAQKKLATTEKTLKEDKVYLADLTVMCDEKKKTFEERKAVRENELNALKSAIDIMTEGMKPVSEKSLIQKIAPKSHPVSINLVRAAAITLPVIQAAEAAAESLEAKQAPAAKKSLSFLQVRSSSSEKELKAKIVAYLRSKSTELQSPALLSLARHAIRNDNLKAVRDMLQGMIDRLKDQDAEATDHKAFCDKSMEENAAKRDEASAAVSDHNAKMATAQAERDTLKEEIAMLTKQIADLEKSQKETTDIRDEEKQENEDSIAEAKDGKDATESAIEVLKKFYESNAFIQQPPTGPAADAPDAGFKNGERNKGSQAEATGVLGMLDVILADMDRTISDTEKAEAAASTEYDQFMTESNADKDQKQSDITEKETQVAGLETDIAGEESSLTTQMQALNNAMNEAADLDAACNVKANYAERIAKRDNEIKEIQKAIDFFNDPTKTLALR